MNSEDLPKNNPEAEEARTDKPAKPFTELPPGIPDGNLPSTRFLDGARGSNADTVVGGGRTRHTSKDPNALRRWER